MQEQNLPEQFLIEEYRALWHYYELTLLEKQRIFDLFLKVVTLPGGLILAFASLAPVDGTYLLIELELGVGLLQFSGLMSLFVATIGIAIFVTFIKETKNSRTYYRGINEIRSYIRGIAPHLDGVIVTDKLRAARSTLPQIGGISFWKSASLAILNSGFASFGVLLLVGFGFGLGELVLVFAVFGLLHALIGHYATESY